MVAAVNYVGSHRSPMAQNGDHDPKKADETRHRRPDHVQRFTEHRSQRSSNPKPASIASPFRKFVVIISFRFGAPLAKSVCRKSELLSSSPAPRETKPTEKSL